MADDDAAKPHLQFFADGVVPTDPDAANSSEAAQLLKVMLDNGYSINRAASVLLMAMGILAVTHTTVDADVIPRMEKTLGPHFRAVADKLLERRLHHLRKQAH